MVAGRDDTTPFGALLRRHRTQRALSQERLAREAEISARHLSCLETGRAAPSREMVLVLGSALDLPLRDRNALLSTCGFASAYRDDALDAPEAIALRQAVELVLEGFQPNAAIAFDRSGKILRMNPQATRLFAAFIDMEKAPREVTRNVLIATLHPRGLRPWIVNFDEVASMALERAWREAARYPDDVEIARVRQTVDRIPDLPRRGNGGVPAASAPFVTLRLEKGKMRAAFFTTLTSMGTPIDVSAEEIRIETYFPLDLATAELTQELARRS